MHNFNIFLLILAFMYAILRITKPERKEIIMNKTQFINAIADKAGLSKTNADDFYNAFVDVVTETLKSGEKIQLAGFGNFEIKERAERDGHNPATGEEIKIAASKSPAFKASKAFKDQF